ncbi:MAG: hypothetical protein WKF73_22350 [Nocardioidaceae bacterium]
MRDKDDPETLGYLEAENLHTAAKTAHLAGLREAIFTEIKTRTQETDLSVPARTGSFWRYSRTVQNQQYPLLCRLPIAEEETGPLLSWCRGPRSRMKKSCSTATRSPRVTTSSSWANSR